MCACVYVLVCVCLTVSLEEISSMDKQTQQQGGALEQLLLLPLASARRGRGEGRARVVVLLGRAPGLVGNAHARLFGGAACPAGRSGARGVARRRKAIGSTALLSPQPRGQRCSEERGSFLSTLGHIQSPHVYLVLLHP